MHPKNTRGSTDIGAKSRTNTITPKIPEAVQRLTLCRIDPRVVRGFGPRGASWQTAKRESVRIHGAIATKPSKTYIMKDSRFSTITVKSIAKSMDSYMKTSDFEAAEKAAIKYINRVSGSWDHDQPIVQAQAKQIQLLQVGSAIKHASQTKNTAFFIGLGASILGSILVAAAFGPTAGWMTVLKFSSAFLVSAGCHVAAEKIGNEQALAHYLNLSCVIEDDCMAICAG